MRVGLLAVERVLLSLLASSVYLLYWYKIIITDAAAGRRSGLLLLERARNAVDSAHLL